MEATAPETPEVDDKIRLEARSKARYTRLNYDQFKSWPLLVQQYGPKLKRANLGGLAVLIGEMFPNVPKLSRAKCRKSELLLQWFDNNWDVISPVLPFVRWADEEGHTYVFK